MPVLGVAPAGCARQEAVLRGAQGSRAGPARKCMPVCRALPVPDRHTSLFPPQEGVRRSSPAVSKVSGCSFGEPLPVAAEGGVPGAKKCSCANVMGWTEAQSQASAPTHCQQALIGAARRQSATWPRGGRDTEFARSGASISWAGSAHLLLSLATPLALQHPQCLNCEGVGGVAPCLLAGTPGSF